MFFEKVEVVIVKCAFTRYFIVMVALCLIVKLLEFLDSIHEVRKALTLLFVED